jgi:shikimate dehydrogenase
MSQYGLLGRSLSHSFSKNYFGKKFEDLLFSGNTYSNFELDHIEGFPALLKAEPGLVGLNVTYPYKEAVIEYLNDLSPEAKEIGAVNCIKISKGKTTGHNTDTYGFSQSIKPFLDHHHERALLLGTGGGSKAVAFVLGKMGVEIFYATSDPEKRKEGKVFLYEELNGHMMNACKLIVNCTPVGMYPDVDKFPSLPYSFFGPQHLAYDLIYNPEETVFLSKAKEAGAQTLNGMSMLKLQAEKSWEIWNEAPH